MSKRHRRSEPMAAARVTATGPVSRPAPVGAVAVIAPPPPEVFASQYVGANVPVLIRGAMTEWPALKLWTDGYLDRALGRVSVDVEISRSGYFGHVEPTWRATSMRMSRFLRAYQARTRQHLYVATVLPKQLASDVQVPVWAPYLSTDMLAQVTLWFGAGDQISRLHNDKWDNLLCLIAGRKRVVLIDGFDGAQVYEDVDCEDKVSPVDIEYPDLERFPAFAGIRPIEIAMTAGDILYIPVCWFHQIYSYERNIAVSMWFDFHDIAGKLHGTGGLGLPSCQVLSRLLSGPLRALEPGNPIATGSLRESAYFQRI